VQGDLAGDPFRAHAGDGEGQVAGHPDGQTIGGLPAPARACPVSCTFRAVNLSRYGTSVAAFLIVIRLFHCPEEPFPLVNWIVGEV
jgi:hypothetical protein